MDMQSMETKNSIFIMLKPQGDVLVILHTVLILLISIYSDLQGYTVHPSSIHPSYHNRLIQFLKRYPERLPLQLVQNPRTLPVLQYGNTFILIPRGNPVQRTLVFDSQLREDRSELRHIRLA